MERAQKIPGSLCTQQILASIIRQSGGQFFTPLNVANL